MEKWLQDELIRRDVDLDKGIIRGTDLVGKNGGRAKVTNWVFPILGKRMNQIIPLVYDPDHKLMGLTDIPDTEENRNKYRKKPYDVLCLCDCGKVFYGNSNFLKEGKLCSCGCAINRLVAESNHRRGKMTAEKYHTRLFMIYNDMIHRCYDENNASYKHYGAKGIEVCNAWRNPKGSMAGYEEFSKWMIDHGYIEQDTQTTKRGKLLTIDRIDTTLGYTPMNCVVRTKSEVKKPRKRSYDGVESIKIKVPNKKKANVQRDEDGFIILKRRE